MSVFVKRLWANGREASGFARWNADAVNNLEDRIDVAFDAAASGGSGAPQTVNQGTITTDTTLDMSNRQDVLWVVTLGAPNLKLEITGWSTAKSVTLIVKQDATGGRFLAGLPTAKWEGGAIPTGSSVSNAIDIRTFFRGLTETYGFEAGTGMA